MKRIHPWWPTASALVGLVLIFFGERVFAGGEGARAALDTIGGLALAAALAARGRDLLRANERAKPVQLRLALSTGALVLGVLLYALIPLLDGASPRAESVLWGLSPLVLALGLASLLALEIAVAPVASQPTYELARVHTATRRGLGLGLVLGVLGFTNLLAARHDAKWELSAGSRAVASEATLKVARELTKAARIVAFFPKANEVGDVVMRYLEALDSANPRITVERRDHALASELAARANVTENGWVAIYHDQAEEKVRVGLKARSARSALRRLDRNVLKALLTATMRPRIAYHTTGHGERPLRRPDEDDPRPPLTLVKKQLENWQFEVKPLGVAEGLASEVPEDASVVMILGPEKPFLPAEIETLEAALERGVRLLVALERDAEDGVLEPLLRRLGLQLDPTPLAHLRAHVPLTRTRADRSLIWSNRYSSHPSVTTMSRNERLATVFSKTGALEKLEAGPQLEKAKLDVVLNAVEGTFADADEDLEKDPDEPTGAFPLAAALTRTSTQGKEAETRAFVLSDVDVLADELAKMVQGNLYLFGDAIYWLQVDRQPIVPAIDEKDVRIVHKAEEDALLFYGTSFGAPLLVLGAGALATRRRRRR